jgi:hypothetical protein
MHSVDAVQDELESLIGAAMPQSQINRLQATVQGMQRREGRFSFLLLTYFVLLNFLLYEVFIIVVCLS